MEAYNIFILSVGRRVELVQSFKRAAERLNLKSTIVGGDCSELAPALYFTDKKIILPQIEDPDYIKAIIEVCKNENIALIIPTIDTDLLLLAENKEYIEAETNAKVMISEENTIRICRDKALTQKFFDENGIKMPKMYSLEELDNPDLQFPLFAKPRDGSSSINTIKIENHDELKAYLSRIDNALIQDFLDGDEITADVFLDFDSNVITIVPRLRIAARGGEIMKAKIVKDRAVIDDIKIMLSKLKFIGHITVQLKKTLKGIEYFEINPRFGGGAPMSIHSGADSCENIYRILRGEKLSYNEDFKDNIYFVRFDNSICLNENWELVQC